MSRKRQKTTRTRQVIISILLFTTLISLGCIGYMVIEDWTFLDSLYMTIITLATVGYSEVNEVSTQGRIFTLLLIILGGGFFVYLMKDFINFLVEGRIRSVLGRYKLDNQIKKLEGHFVICGYGRIGKILTRYLVQKYIDVVVIEKDERCIERMNDDGILYLVGEAGNEDMLIRAGVKNAKGIIAVTATDAENVFLILIAKQLNPDVFVVARASEDASKKTLHAAGADKVISPYDIGARRMAHAILRPTVIKFLETAFADEETDIQLEEIQVKTESRLAGVALKDSDIRKGLNLIVLAIRTKSGDMHFNPKGDAIIEPGDTMVTVGSAKSLVQLEIMLHG